MEKERYYKKKIIKDCLFPEGLFEIKDRNCKKWSLIIEDKKNTDKIVKLLNQQDTIIKELEEENGYIIFADEYDENGNEVNKQIYTTYKLKCDELIKENQQLKEQCNLLQEAITMQSNTIEEYVKTENERLRPLNHQLAVKDKALELAIADKCKVENIIAESIVGKGAKVSVPKKEQWYLEQAEKELKEQ